MEFMCRVCETIYGLKNMFEEENEELLLMLRSVANITVDVDDQLPKYLCEECCFRLDHAYCFKEECETADRKLRKLIDTKSRVELEKEHKQNLIIKMEPQFYEMIDEKSSLPTAEAHNPILKTQSTDTLYSLPNNKLPNQVAYIERVDLTNSKHFAFANNGNVISIKNGITVMVSEPSTTSIKSILIPSKDVQQISTDQKEETFEMYNGDVGENVIIEEYEYTGMEANDEIEEKMVEENFYEDEEILVDEMFDDNIENPNLDINDDSALLEVISESNSLDHLKQQETEKIFENSTELETDNPNVLHEEPTNFNKQDFKCEERDQTETDILQTQSVSSTTTSDNPVICNLCKATYINKAALLKHKRERHPIKKHQCNDCGKFFVKPESLRNHQVVHGKGPRFDCDICGKTYSFFANLRRHKHAVHNQIKNYVCDICDKAFARNSALELHRVTHTIERNYSCEQCNKKFKTPLHVRQHIAIVHLKKYKNNKKRTRPKEPYICYVCGKISYTLPIHLTHLKIHTTTREKYYCKYCPKFFHFKPYLATHELIHTGERPYKCELCDKRFRQKAHLNAHTLIMHTDQKPYVCRYCNKGFAQNGTLRVHERIHTGERPYVCELCPGKFIDSNGLKKHKLKVHNGIVGKPKQNKKTEMTEIDTVINADEKELINSIVHIMDMADFEEVEQ